MRKFQIQEKNNHGGAHYSYFDVDDNFPLTEIQELAMKKATEEKEKAFERHIPPMFSKAPKIRPCKVVEYDQIKHTTKRGGVKFKLKVGYISTTFKGGKVLRQSWYYV